MDAQRFFGPDNLVWLSCVLHFCVGMARVSYENELWIVKSTRLDFSRELYGDRAACDG